MRQIPRYQLCLLLTVASLLLALPALGAASPPLGKWEVAMAERGGKRMAFPSALVWTFEFFKGGKLIQRRGMKGKQIKADKERWVVRGEKMAFTSAKGKEDSVVLKARGDLDCDGKLSSYKLVGRVVKGKVSFGAVEAKNELE